MKRTTRETSVGLQYGKSNFIGKWALALAVCLGATVCQAQITKDLVVHLTFDNAYTNSVANGVDGAAVGSPTFSPGKIGSAVALTTLRDGSSFNYVTFGAFTPDLLNFGSVRDGNAVDFTIAFWCNYTNQVDDPPFISNKNWNSSNNQGWGIFTQGGGNFRVNVTDDTGGNGKQNTTATPVIRDGKWHHVVVAFARQTIASVYVDGALVTTSPMSQVQGPIDASMAVNIGQDGTGGYTDGGSAEMINVLMDDLGIWRRALSAGEVLAIYNAGLGGTNLANVPAIVDPYVKSTTPANGDAGVRPDATITAVITDGLNAVAAGSVQMIVNGAVVPATVTKTGTDTTAVYTPTNLLPTGANVALVVFANNASPQGHFTNSVSFSVASYITLTPDLKVTPDTSKPGFVWSIFANSANTLNSNSRTEAALAGQLQDATGAPLPNLADPTAQGVAIAAGSAPSPANAPIKFEIATVVNLNAVGGSSAGNFPTDDQMPGVPATDMTTDGLAAEILTYLDLPAGLTVMGVNSDDGFRTTAGRTPQDQFSALLAGEFDGARGAADTLFFINVQQAGVYAFRTTYENGTGGADIEWFTVKPDGTKVLVNDTVSGGIKAYRAATTTTPPYVKYVVPTPVQRQVNQVSSSLVIVLADGTTALDDASVQLKLDGAAPAVTKVRAGKTVTLTYAPTTIQFPEDQHEAQLAYKDTAGTAFQANWTFCSLKNIVLPAPAIFEDFNSYTEGDVPTGWAQTNYTDCSGGFCATPGLDLDNLNSDTYRAWVVVGKDRLNGLKSRIFANIAPNQMSNGVPVTALSDGNLIYAESDVRDGNQVQFLYTKAYNLSAVKNAAVAFSSLYEQNQDSLGAVEYSVDAGATWQPVVYYLDFLDAGGDIRTHSDGTVDAVLTFNEPNTDTAYWTVNGVQKGGNYGDGIAAPITQALGRFVAPRANDDPVEGKRLEIYRLPLAGGKSDVRLRFAQLGTGSWYFGVDNLGFYDVPAPMAPRLTIAAGSANNLSVAWIGAGTLLEATSVTGPWTVSASQANPQTVPIAGAQKFYRIGPP